MLPSNVINIGLLNTTKKNRFNFITSIQHITITYQTRRNANIKMSHRHQSTQKIRKKDLNVQLSSQCHIKRVTSQVGLLTTKKIRSNVITSVQHTTLPYLARHNSNIKMSHHMCHIDFGLLKEMRKKGLNIQSSSTCHITLQSTQNDQEKQVQFYNISLTYIYIILSTTQCQHRNVTSHVPHRHRPTQKRIKGLNVILRQYTMQCNTMQMSYRHRCTSQTNNNHKLKNIDQTTTQRISKVHPQIQQKTSKYQISYNMQSMIIINIMIIQLISQ
eukprot:TRINITY_DN212_c1_g1_i1.p2 TRINITY_DN212_c1_g1~~TRINITY_DN212_c1_g1_i1.p2  ORF type:complete len:273 (-),score=-43.34 TRINITY_DN212_c1_g1_i1:415-1233(-)